MNDGRTLRVGATLAEVFDLYREHLAVLLPAAFWVYLPVGILLGVAGNDTAAFYLVVLLALVIDVVFQGMVVSVVHAGGEAPTVRKVLTSIGPVLSILVPAGVVYAIGVAAGASLFLIPGLILITIWALIAPVIVIERLGVTAALSRSQALVRGHGWQVFGVVLAAVLLATLAAGILGVAVGLIAGGPIVQVVLATLATTVAAPVNGLVAIVLYQRLLAIKGEPPAGVRL